MKRALFLGLGSLAALLAACGDPSVFGENNNPSGGDGGTSAATSNGGSAQTSSSNGGSGGFAASTGAGGNGGCNPGADEDFDGDGFSINQGDCNDCEPLENPNAIEVVGNSLDEDCSGATDDPLPSCDGGVAIDADTPTTIVAVLDLCKVSSGVNSWGVVDSKWVMADGSAPPADAQDQADFHLGHGVMNDFGPNVAPKGGVQMLVLSNGWARRPGDPDYAPVAGGGKGYQSPLPAPFPKNASDCMANEMGPANDPVGFEMTVRAPSNVHGFAFHFDFYATDFPSFVCTQYNDGFAALVTPVPAGLADELVAFHGPAQDPFTLNGAPFDVCGCANGPPCMAGGKSYACSQGTARLLGNGFGDDVDENRGATGWQRTTVPVEPNGEFSIRFTVWDVSDSGFTSTALIDGWQWLTDEGVTTSTVPAP